MTENNQLSIVDIQGIRGYIDKEGRAWLNLEDVSRGLGFTEFKNGKDYVMWRRVYQYLREFNFGTNAEENNSQLVNQDIYIPEEIFYRLAMKANNETAVKFQIKIATEILPALRRYGIYATSDAIEMIINNPDFGIELLTKLKFEREARAKAEEQAKQLQEENIKLLPKVEHYDTVMNSEKLLDMKDTAKVLDFCELVIYFTKKGIKKEKIKSIGRNRLFEILRDLGILMKDNRPYQSYVDLGYFKLVEVTVPREGKDLVFIVTYVKQKGLEFLRKTLLNEGYFPREKKESFWNEEELNKVKMLVNK